MKRACCLCQPFPSTESQLAGTEEASSAVEPLPDKDEARKREHHHIEKERTYLHYKYLFLS